MNVIKTFEDLKIWQKGRELSILIFRLSEKGSFAKDFPLKNQIRGSSGSVMDNIAEGFERNSKLEFIQFLSVAKGSCGETRSQIIRAADFGYISAEEQNERNKQNNGTWKNDR
ncbi:MAG TPA: four helix bundle protein [Chitinophagales bacterium]|nr:four helix bundle protein [Chitinophagales bacterium]